MDKNQYTHYYDKQLYRYILQFMAIFSDMQVSVNNRDTGQEELITVHLHYASQDRITHAILAGNTQNTPIRLPAMSVYMKDIDLAPEQRKGVAVERRNAYVPVGGMLPNDVKVVYQRQPVPYTMQIELSMHASSVDQHFQLLEQILTLFDPMITLQTSDGIFDATKITSVELKRINIDDTTVQEINSRIIRTTMVFELPIYLSLPADVRDNAIHKILVRVGMINSGDLPEDAINIFDQSGILYDVVTDAADIPFS